MSLPKLRIMWCCIILAVAALLYMPHHQDIIEPIDSKVMTPPKVERIQNYVVVELLIVGLFIAGGVITIKSAVKRLPLPGATEQQLELPQKDAKPSAEEPLLVLTDEQG